MSAQHTYFRMFLICIDFTAKYKINGVISFPDAMTYDKLK